MTERNPDTQDIEIDLSRLLRTLLRRWWVLLSATVCGGLLLFSIAFFILTPRYTATATMYVMNSTSSGSSVTNSDLTASQSLVDTYIAILKTRTTLEQAIEATGVSYTYEELSDMVSADAVNSTELFEISVTSTDPEEAAALTNALAELLPDRFTELVGGTAAYLADRAVPPSEPSSPPCDQTHAHRPDSRTAALSGGSGHSGPG
ncbi:MAG: Wzz/FepE/Etk N-terminal domain-containing protein [Oscillospiraceae bacterium]|nr:Wzz/FepE/Etk N-terminal domain-containing protein [Oscillospiraceae bacterium]